MPELPDLLHIQSTLTRELVGQGVTGQRVREPILLRCALPGGLSLLEGARLQEIQRRTHFLVFRFGALDLAVNPMLAGRFRLEARTVKDPASLGLALAFGERELRYFDDKKMGKAYLLPRDEWSGAPGLTANGVYVLSPEFTEERFLALLRGRRDQVRLFLMDKKALDSLGNAYADEDLFEACIHPKTWCRSLSPEAARKLHGAIVRVLRDAVAEVARRNEPIDVKVRDFLKIRLRTECPRCGGRVRRAGVRGMDSYFCPHCQPATRDGLVDWTRIGPA
jgi:formamidopyrimidine-DNA glycosylase